MGASFEAHNSESYGGDVGRSFTEKNGEEERHKREHKSHAWIWITAIIVIVVAILLVERGKSDKTSTKAGAGGAAAGKSGGGRGQQGPAAITVGQSKTGNINVYVDALGTVTPTNTVTIYSQITGKVMAVYYREGQIVRKGQPLIDIDPRPYEATLTQAEGTLQHDQGVLAEARIDLERYQIAFSKNAIARQQLEDQQQVVLQDEGTVKTDEGTVAYDKVQLSYCHIVSPINGRVGLRLVDPGNTVFSGTGSTLVVVTQLQPITVVFNVSEDDLPAIQAQLKGGRTLEVDAYDRANDKQIEAGKLNSLDNQIDTTTGTVKFRAGFNNTGLTLFPNQFVNARLLEKTLKGTVLVPSAAVQHNGTQAFVYVVKPNKTVGVQNVTALTSDEKDTAVQGLGAGTDVATSGFDRLENGVPVLINQKAPGQAAAQGHGSNGSAGGSTTP
ncbi:efflux transporter, RND family, MFP subunit (plasmid) [Granulicella tundricola MP5ACTX9]|uniref:Efflux transporter, RND family, MFP subunit n=1 Tax=Granulicella tundricola (strain ATCC BAA-1859 / DSM 23138 / MP5ACTX9) TaxID=1198114 RepID=E8X675_GRATM|nr:efflux transporter, RND family, MFP subunit [Granulicella tundricola MP5ACTX9]